MDNTRREQVRAGLPAQSLALMDELEAFAGIPIGFDRYPLDRGSDLGLVNPNQAATEISHDQATIYLGRFDEINAYGVTHELLHIHRCWIEGIPQLHPVDEKASKEALKACGNVDNDLEHLAIVPREAAYGFDSTSYWNGVSRAKWNAWPWPEIVDPVAKRNGALLGWLALDLVTDQVVRDHAAECLRKQGLAGEAARFAKRIHQMLPSKPRALSCCVRFLNFPRRDVRLVYFDIRGRTRRVEVLPEH